MIKPRIDITGHQYGLLIPISFIKNKDSRAWWKCVCKCGKIVSLRAATLRYGSTKSCGCLNSKMTTKRNKILKHGKTDTSIYRTWINIRARCENKNSSNYKHYGGRGITICKEWNSFENFYKDMGDRPSPTLTIDRIDNDKGYFPQNCRWATKSQQRINQRPKQRKTI